MPTAEHYLSPTSLTPLSATLPSYRPRDDESASDRPHLESLVLHLATQLSSLWTHELPKLTESGAAWHALGVRGLGGGAVAQGLEVTEEGTRLVLWNGGGAGGAGGGYVSVEVEEGEVARYA